MGKVSILKELYDYAKIRKKWWLVPIVVVLLLFGGVVLLFTQTTWLAPVIYPLF